MERVAEADSPEPIGGVEQRGADPQPPVFSQHQLTVCQLHAALRQREQLAAFQAARERGISWPGAVDLYRARYAARQPLAMDAAALRTAGRVPRAIREQGSAAVEAYLSARNGTVKGEDVLR